MLKNRWSYKRTLGRREASQPRIFTGRLDEGSPGGSPGSIGIPGDGARSGIDFQIIRGSGQDDGDVGQDGPMSMQVPGVRESRCGLRGVQVGEASHPGPKRRCVRRVPSSSAESHRCVDFALIEGFEFSPTDVGNTMGQRCWFQHAQSGKGNFFSRRWQFRHGGHR